ncbi:embryonic polarity protein dorsal-like [Anticarsia gemmatalis]|uniref:embryonic polarity protein dorsal-like n=1 Tax=Anticarsia gemmatalis TaxID=129554 RepID=UPI003F758874
MAKGKKLSKGQREGMASGSSDVDRSRSGLISVHGKPFARMSEEPARKERSFRYPSEGRVGNIPGANSTPERKTYPAIQIIGCRPGPVKIVASCVTENEPYRQHPHHVVIQDFPTNEARNRELGVSIITTHIGLCNEIRFEKLGIVCTKKEDRANVLRRRQEVNIDPEEAGFDHIEDLSSISMHVVRLCFQVFLPDETGRCCRPLKPVISEKIYDKKIKSDLVVHVASECSGPARGGTKLILLCEKVTKDDKPVFYQEGAEEDRPWKATVETTELYKTMAVIFKTPPYENTSITEPVTVKFHLESAKSVSLPFEFTYLPEYTGPRSATTSAPPRNDKQLAAPAPDSAGPSSRSSPVEFDLAADLPWDPASSHLRPVLDPSPSCMSETIQTGFSYMQIRTPQYSSSASSIASSPQTPVSSFLGLSLDEEPPKCYLDISHNQTTYSYTFMASDDELNDIPLETNDTAEGGEIATDISNALMECIKESLLPDSEELLIILNGEPPARDRNEPTNVDFPLLETEENELSELLSIPQTFNNDV